MRIFSKLLIAGFSMVLIMGCSGEEDRKEHHSHEVQKDEQRQDDAEQHQHTNDESHGHHQEDEGLKLKESGEKWTADKPTHASMNTLSDTVHAFQNKSTINVKDYHTLGEELERQMNDIFKNCKMKGEAHDELHKVLLPVHQSIGVLKKEKDLQKLEHAFEKVKKQVHLYFEYFQSEQTGL